MKTPLKSISMAVMLLSGLLCFLLSDSAGNSSFAHEIDGRQISRQYEMILQGYRELVSTANGPEENATGGPLPNALPLFDVIKPVVLREYNFDGTIIDTGVWMVSPAVFTQNDELVMAGAGRCYSEMTLLYPLPDYFDLVYTYKIEQWPTHGSVEFGVKITSHEGIDAAYSFECEANRKGTIWARRGGGGNGRGNITETNGQIRVVRRGGVSKGYHLREGRWAQIGNSGIDISSRPATVMFFIKSSTDSAYDIRIDTVVVRTM